MDEKAIDSNEDFEERLAIQEDGKAPYESDLIPPETIFEDYIRYISVFSESPTEFHIFTLIHTISCVLRRGCYIIQGEDTIFPNLYTIIVAPSSLYKKSSSIQLCNKFLSRAGCWEDHFLGHIGSPEGLFDGLSDNGTGFLFYSEIGLLLAQANKKYMVDIIDMLNDIYDCPEVFCRKLSKELKRVEKPYVTLLSASQLSSLTEHIKEQTLLSGFLPRFAVVFSEKIRPHMVRRPEPDANLQYKITKQLSEIHTATKVSRKMELDDRAWNGFEKWAMDRHQAAMIADDLVKPFMGRLETLCLKFAMIVRKAKDPQGLIIEIDDIITASRWADFCLKSYQRLVLEELTFNEEDGKLKRISDIVKKGKHVAHRIIVQGTKFDDQTIRKKTKILCEMGKVRIEEGPRGGKTYRWIAEGD